MGQYLDYGVAWTAKHTSTFSTTSRQNTIASVLDNKDGIYIVSTIICNSNPLNVSGSLGTFRNFSVQANEEAVLAKYSTSTGALVWAISMIGASSDSLAQVHYDAVNNTVIVVGTIKGTTNFAGLVVSESVGAIVYAIVNAVDGVVVSTVHRAATFSDSSTAVTISGFVFDSVNRVFYLAGFFTNSLKIKSGSGNEIEFKSAGSSDGFVAKYTAEDARLVWFNRIGSTGIDKVLHLAMRGSNLVAVGSFQGIIQFSTNIVLEMDVLQTQGYNGMLLKLNPATGAVTMAKQFDSAGASDVQRVLIDSNDNMYIVGAYIVDLLNTNNVVAPASSFFTTFAARLSPSGVYQWLNPIISDQNAVVQSVAFHPGTEDVLYVSFASSVTPTITVNAISKNPLKAVSCTTSTALNSVLLKMNSTEGSPLLMHCASSSFSSVQQPNVLAIDNSTHAIYFGIANSNLYSTFMGNTISTTGGGDAVIYALTESCSPCVKGTHSSVPGIITPTSCNICVGGTFQNQTGQASVNSCQNCAVGSYSLGGAATCTLCPAGYYASGASVLNSLNTSCTPCASGFYSSAIGATSINTCVQCASKASTQAVGSSTPRNCFECDLGSYSTLKPVQIINLAQSENHEQLNGVVVDSKGFSYAVGQFQGVSNIGGINLTSTGSFDAFLVKYNGSVAIWASHISGEFDEFASGITIDSQDNIYIIGTYGRSCSIRSINGSIFMNIAGKDVDVFVVKYSSSGAISWVRTFGSAGAETTTSISADGAGNVYISAIGMDNIDVFGTNIQRQGVIALDTNGVLRWANTTIFSVRRIAVDVSGSILVYGGISEFGTNIASLGLTHLGINDIILCRVNTANGALLWATRYGSPAADAVNALLIHENFIYAGMFTLSTSGFEMLNADKTVYATLSNDSPSVNGIIAKISPSGIVQAHNLFVHGAQPLTLSKDVFGNILAAGTTVASPTFFYNSANKISTQKSGEASTSYTTPACVLQCAFVTKLDQNLNMLDVHVISSSKKTNGLGVASFDSGRVLFVGAMAGSSTGSLPLSTLGNNDGFSILLDIECVSCPLGTYSILQGTLSIITCTSCPKGTYNPLPKGSSIQACLLCPNGTYNSLTRSTSVQSCLACDLGSTSLAGSNDKSKCFACPLGSYGRNTTFLGAGVCDPCPLGTTTTATGLTSVEFCLKCEAGTYADILGASACKLCPSGRYNNNTGSSSVSDCIPCEKGTYGGKSQLRSALDCDKCPSGTYNPNLGAVSQSQCLLCQNGTSTYPGAQSSFDCKSCELGFVAGVNGCERCKPGTFAKIAGVCAPCSAGEYSSLDGQFSCTKCDAGRYSTVNGSKSSDDCILCPFGTTSTTIGASSIDFCKPCQAGTFSAIDRRTCLSCAAGSYSNVIGASNSTVCKLCQVGTYGDEVGATSMAACKNCPAGSFNGKEGASFAECLSCPSGQYSNAGSSGCIACDAGSFSSIARSPSCTLCPEGTFASAANMSLCTPCPANSFNVKLGATFCDSCSNTSFCLIGTRHPLNNSISAISITDDPYFAQPANLPKSAVTSFNTNVFRFAFLGSSIGATILLILLCFALIGIAHLLPQDNKFRKLIHIAFSVSDMYTNRHFTRMNKSPIRRNTLFGGVISIICVCAFVIMFILLVYETATLNTFTKVSIIPDTVISSEIANTSQPVRGTFVVNIELFNFLEPNCNASVKQIRGFGNKEQVLFTKTDTSCNISIVCTQCVLDGATQSISLTWNSDYAMASAIRYSVSVPHFWQQQMFNITETVVPAASNSVFRGTSVPTEISIAVLKSFLTGLANDAFVYSLFSRSYNSTERTQKGYVANKLPLRLGAQTPVADFASSTDKGLSIVLSLTADSNVFYVEQEQRTTLLDFLAKLASLASAIYSLCALTMASFEWSFAKLSDIRKGKQPDLELK